MFSTLFTCIEREASAGNDVRELSGMRLRILLGRHGRALERLAVANGASSSAVVRVREWLAGTLKWTPR
jgi:hypothetical protein